MTPPPKPPPKRRKVDGDGSNRRNSPSSEKDKDIESSKVTESQQTDFNKILEDRDNAVRQARQDGCTGSYRIFDSSFGNFMLPVIPSMADLLK